MNYNNDYNNNNNISNQGILKTSNSEDGDSNKNKNKYIVCNGNSDLATSPSGQQQQ